MNRVTRVLTLISIVALLAPTGLATWKGYGTFEPDNSLDDKTFMFFDEPEYTAADSNTVKQIYFNAYQTQYQHFNPNVGAIGSQISVYGDQWWNAVLGVWVDCNNDGYIGLAETVVEEYRDTLLTDKSRCEPGKSDHNKNGWVLELIPIGTFPEVNKNRDGRVIYDETAMIWGDFGLPAPGPDDPINAPTPQGTCAVYPGPGSLQRTGGLLFHLDCITGRRVGLAYNTVAEQSGGLLQPLENSRNWDEAGHPLNQPTFGSDDASNSYAHAQDCSQPTLLQSQVAPVADPILPEGPAQEIATNTYKNGPRPLPPGGVQVNPNGNLAGTVNRTWEDLSIDHDATPTSNCDTSDDYGHDLYVEGENTGVDAHGKNQADYNFNFSAQRRGGIPLGAGTFGPAYAGLWYSTYYDFQFSGPTRWVADGHLINYPFPVRANVNAGTVNITGADYWTFYAHVGSASTAVGKVPGGSGLYGQGFCPDGFQSPIVTYGWICDADEWYVTAEGPVTETYPLARPGQTYNLRDVDCLDGTVAEGLPVGIDGAAYSETPCA